MFLAQKSVPGVGGLVFDFGVHVHVPLQCRSGFDGDEMGVWGPQDGVYVDEAETMAIEAEREGEDEKDIVMYTAWLRAEGVIE